MLYILMVSPENSEAPRPHISPGPPPIRTLHVRLTEILQQLKLTKADATSLSDTIVDALRAVDSVLRFIDDISAKDHDE